MFLILFIAASPLVTHFALVSGEWGAMAYVLILGQTALALWFILARLKRPYKHAAAIGLLACSLTLCALHLRTGLILSSGVPHALIYLGLLTFFGTSLLPGRIPVVTLLSHRIHGALPVTIDRYTRNVTWVWCLFFVAQLFGSAILVTFAPVTWWSTFVNILNAPLLACMLLGEELSRPFWVRNPPREDLSDMLQMVALVKGNLTKRDPSLL